MQVNNYDAAKWCFDKGYKIYPKPVDFSITKYGSRVGVKFKIVIEYGSEIRVGQKEFTKKEWPDKIFAVYEHLYNKYGEKN